jgi:hypothetical protein
MSPDHNHTDGTLGWPVVLLLLVLALLSAVAIGGGFVWYRKLVQARLLEQAALAEERQALHAARQAAAKAAAAAPGLANEADAKAIRGEWRCTSLNVDGQAVKLSAASALWLTMNGKLYLEEAGGKEIQRLGYELLADGVIGSRHAVRRSWGATSSTGTSCGCATLGRSQMMANRRRRLRSSRGRG